MLCQENSGDLQAVLDMVVSHQGADRKSLFIRAVLLSLVLPSPADYRPLLRRLTALTSKGTSEVVAQAQQLLEQSLLTDLRVVVARALSGGCIGFLYRALLQCSHMHARFHMPIQMIIEAYA